MPDHGRRSPARLLAPLALVVFAVALLIVVGSSDGDGDGGGQTTAADRTGAGTTQRTETAPAPGPATYTVQTGDTLGGIAEQVGVSVERLQELNPEVDPQALVAGQKIKLRE